MAELVREPMLIIQNSLRPYAHEEGWLVVYSAVTVQFRQRDEIVGSCSDFPGMLSRSHQSGSLGSLECVLLVASFAQTVQKPADRLHPAVASRACVPSVSWNELGPCHHSLDARTYFL